MPKISTTTKKTNSKNYQSFPRNNSRTSHVHHHLWPQPKFPWNGDPSIRFLSSKQHKPIFTTQRTQTQSYQCHWNSRSNHWSRTTLQTWKRKFTTYCEFRIILISMITNKCQEKYMKTIKHRITKFCQCKLINLLDHICTECGTITSSNLTANFKVQSCYWNWLWGWRMLWFHTQCICDQGD